ncbi:hypothetical protein D3C77_277390 [compost metagenome]
MPLILLLFISDYNPNRVLTREPANRTRDVYLGEDGFPAVPFQIHDHMLHARPLMDRYAQRRQEQVVHFRVVGMVGLLQQHLGFLRCPLDVDSVGILL